MTTIELQQRVNVADKLRTGEASGVGNSAYTRFSRLRRSIRGTVPGPGVDVANDATKGLAEAGKEAGKAEKAVKHTLFNIVGGIFGGTVLTGFIVVLDKIREVGLHLDTLASISHSVTSLTQIGAFGVPGGAVAGFAISSLPVKYVPGRIMLTTALYGGLGMIIAGAGAFIYGVVDKGHQVGASLSTAATMFNSGDLWTQALLIPGAIIGMIYGVVKGLRL